jgi:hypothetical protein
MKLPSLILPYGRTEIRKIEISHGSADGAYSMHKYLIRARTGVNDRKLARNVFYYEPREIQINLCTCIREANAHN